MSRDYRDQFDSLEEAASQPRFKVGDRVRRDPRIWNDPKDHDHNHAVVLSIEAGKLNSGKSSIGYRILSDYDKKAIESGKDSHGEVLDAIDIKRLHRGTWYAEKELVPEA